MFKCFPGSRPELASCRIEPMTTHFIPKIAVFFTNSSKQSLLLACESWSSGSVLALQMAAWWDDWLRGAGRWERLGRCRRRALGRILLTAFITCLLYSCCCLGGVIGPCLFCEVFSKSTSRAPWMGSGCRRSLTGGFEFLLAPGMSDQTAGIEELQNGRTGA